MDRILNAPRSRVKYGYDYPEKEQDEQALALGLKNPISFSLSHLRSNHSRCRICQLLYHQLDEALYASDNNFEAFIDLNIDEKLESLSLFTKRSKRRVARLDLYQVEGEWDSGNENNELDITERE